MPRYDYVCGQGHEQRDVWAKYGDRPACPECGGATDILWQKSFPNIIRDEIPGGMTIHNMSATPETFYSKSEHKRRCKELGVQVIDRHVGHDHTDKSPYTSRWI
jgi:hypothetical protein